MKPGGASLPELRAGFNLVDATSKDLAAAIDYYRTQIAQAQKEVRRITEFMKKKGGQSSKK
jgi:hypothetical protein